MKSFDKIANPHKYVNLPTKTRRQAPKRNPTKHTLQPVDTTICQVTPLLVHLFPELIEHNIKIKPHAPMYSYSLILKEAGKLRKELLSLL